jgi:hypothetical protein
MDIPGRESTGGLHIVIAATVGHSLIQTETMRWAADVQPSRDALIGTLNLPGTGCLASWFQGESGTTCRLRSRSGDVQLCSCLIGLQTRLLLARRPTRSDGPETSKQANTRDDGPAAAGHRRLRSMLPDRRHADLAETEVGDWTMPNFSAACAYAASQGWLTVEDDVVTLTTAGLRAA